MASGLNLTRLPNALEVSAEVLAEGKQVEATSESSYFFSLEYAIANGIVSLGFLMDSVCCGLQLALRLS